MKQYSEEQKAEIASAYKASRNAKEQKRLQCVKMRVCSGMKTREISEHTGFSITHINLLVRTYEIKGIEGLLCVPQGGNHRLMKPSEEEAFLQGYEATATSGQVLEVSDIHRAMETRLQRKVGPSTVYRMLHRNGWRKVMPRSRHPKKASEEEISSFKKNQ